MDNDIRMGVNKITRVKEMYIRRTKNNWFQHYKPDCTDIQQHESTTIHIINQQSINPQYTVIN